MPHIATLGQDIKGQVEACTEKLRAHIEAQERFKGQVEAMAGQLRMHSEAQVQGLMSKVVTDDILRNVLFFCWRVSLSIPVLGSPVAGGLSCVAVSGA